MKNLSETVIAVVCISFSIFMGIYFSNKFGIIYELSAIVFGFVLPIFLIRYSLLILYKIFPGLKKN